MYQVRYQEQVIRKHIPLFSSPAKKLIQCVIVERLTANPLVFGKPLRYTLKGYRSLRMEDYRVVYKIEATTNTVFIIAIGHRKNIYKNLGNLK